MSYNLIDTESKAQLTEGDRVKTFRGDEARIIAIYPPGTSQGGRGGKVHLQIGKIASLYFPGVIKAEFVEGLPDRVQPRSERERDAREKGYDD